MSESESEMELAFSQLDPDLSDEIVKLAIANSDRQFYPPEALALLASADRGERVRMHGTRTTDTPTLLRILATATGSGAERTLTADEIADLDWHGWHVISARPRLLEGAEADDEYQLGSTSLNLTLDALMPCNAMLKMRSRDTEAGAYECLIDIRVADFVALEEAPYSPRGFLWRTQ